MPTRVTRGMDTKQHRVVCFQHGSALKLYEEIFARPRTWQFKKKLKKCKVFENQWNHLAFQNYGQKMWGAQQTLLLWLSRQRRWKASSQRSGCLGAASQTPHGAGCVRFKFEKLRCSFPMVKKTSMTRVCNPKRICDYTLQNHQSQSANTIHQKKIGKESLLGSWPMSLAWPHFANRGQVWRHTMQWISEQWRCTCCEKKRSFGIPTACWAASAKAATWVGSDLSELPEQILKYILVVQR